MKLSTLPILLLLTLTLSSCATPMLEKPVEIVPPKLPPVPADIMVVRGANFRLRLLNFYSALQTKQMP